MRTLVLSDLHIGDPRYANNKAVQNLLMIEKYDRLILNGDFLDLWISDLEKIVKDPLFKLLEKLAHVKEIIWILGNHDINIAKIGYSYILPHAKKVNLMEINENDKRILILHGHQVYNKQNNYWLIRQLAKLNVFFYRRIGFDFQEFFNRRDGYKRNIHGKRQEILDKYGKGKDVVIIGHTHRIGYCSKDNVQLFDLGSSIITKSYAIIENGFVCIKLNL